MARLIDANALKAEMEYLLKRNDTLVDGWLADRIFEEIEDASTIEAEPTKHGRWIDRGKDMCIRWKCSECGRKDTHIYNYCPDCGARMYEVEE